MDWERKDKEEKRLATIGKRKAEDWCLCFLAPWDAICAARYNQNQKTSFSDFDYTLAFCYLCKPIEILILYILMTEIASKYEPQAVEQKWYSKWIDNKCFASKPDGREPFTVVIPPPNVTGVLHMGHMLNNTIQDVLVRRARMQGKNACWVPGTDHASIATEAKVVAKLKEQGIEKKDLTREEFLSHAWKWKEEHGGIILKQLRHLGASCDWDRTKFTMDEALYESVIDVFVDLYEKGLIYRGVRMVNWDPVALTALSDEEVVFVQQSSKLYYLKYMVEGSDEFVTVATTRPETILGDTAVCVHPEDERYSFLKGKRLIVPLVGRSVPVIFDEYVDREFGTGALKITPAHDINDYNLGLKHKLDVINVFNDNGTLNENGGAEIVPNEFVNPYKSFRKPVLGEVVLQIEQRLVDFLYEPKVCLTRALALRDVGNGLRLQKA